MSGKGSDPRPFEVPYEKFAENFERIFGTTGAHQSEKPEPTIDAVRAAVEKMHRGYQYGCGYYNEDNYVQGQRELFALFGLSDEEKE